MAVVSALDVKDVKVFTAAASGLRRAARWEEAVQLLVQMPKGKIYPDVVNFNATITACSSAGHWQAATALLDSMKQQEVTPDVISYNALLSSCDRAAETRQALLCMARMRSVGITPDQTSYSTLMSAVSRSGEWQVVLHLLSEMQQLTVQTDPVCYSVAMGACEKASQWQVALDLFDAMPQRRLRRDVVSVGNAICAMTKGGSWQGALKLLETMQREAVELDTVVCNSCLNACANAARWQEALDLLKLMTEKKLPKTTPTCNSVVRALESGGEHRRAVAVLLHDFVDEEVPDECVRPSMFRTARPSQITAQLRRSIAERLERHLDFAFQTESECSNASLPVVEPTLPRPVVAVPAEEVRSQIGPCPFWCTEEASQALETLLAPLRATESNQEVPIADELKAALPAAYSDAQVIPYGSIISRFAARDADADFSLLPNDPQQFQARFLQQRVLVEWRRELLSRGHDVSAIGLGGRVPVLTLRWGHSKSRTADVTIGNRLGIYKSLLLREYSLLDERLCDLVLAVKRWAKLREISGQTRRLRSRRFGKKMSNATTWLGVPRRLRIDVQLPSLPGHLPRCSVLSLSSSLNALILSKIPPRFVWVVTSSSSSPRLSLEDPIETDWDLGHILSAHRLCRLRAELRRARRRLRGAPDGCLEAVFQPRGKKCRR
eukprot:s75_g35.t2